MKKVLLGVLIVTALSGCRSIPYESYSTFLDYSSYTTQGFFLSESNSVSFEYKALGSLTGTVSDGDDKGEFKRAYMDDAVKVMIDKAKEVGANGIINIKYDIINTNDRITIIARGMAIKK